LGFLDRLRDGLTRTTQQIVSRFEQIVEQADTDEKRSRPVDVDTIEALEELLLSADVTARACATW
jgi:signal recognition particle GTPase